MKSTEQIITNPLEAESLTELLALILSVVVEIGLVVVVFMIIFTGFKFVVAQGKAEDLKEARRALIATLVGASIILGCYAIASALKNTVEQLKEGVAQVEVVPINLS
jgi:heme/copper-type cytochrome/quinol oxidase subunit 2